MVNDIEEYSLYFEAKIMTKEMLDKLSDVKAKDTIHICTQGVFCGIALNDTKAGDLVSIKI